MFIYTKVQIVESALVIRNLGFYCCGLGSVPGGGTEIPQTECHGIRKKNYELLTRDSIDYSHVEYVD